MKMEIRRKPEQQFSYQTKQTLKNSTRDQEGHCIMIKGSIQEDINNYEYVCTQHRSTSLYKIMLVTVKGEINSNTVRVGDFNTLLTLMDRSSRQKVNKETQALNDTLDQRDITDIQRTFQPKVNE